MKTKKHKYAQTREELVLSLINRETPRALIDTRCVYNKDYNGGCAIGMHINQSLALKLDEFKCSIKNIVSFSMLPQRLKSMGQEFLRRVQEVHDTKSNWYAKKVKGSYWNYTGIDEINSIIEDYNLNLELLKY